ncbi:MAG: UDP-N-acetylmuramoyl-tripeptide--D-alanyl-D-alanine ligase [Clostridia bacterium]|nr:UDP-N-acetylmuramoyl-tripeptide--D-alanyl-D-alanine ligase [Clostridia bacterium]
MNLTALLINVGARLSEALVISLCNTALMFFASFKFVQTLQQSGYEGRGFLSWLRRRDNIYMMRLVILSILSVLAFLIFNIAVMIFIEGEWVVYTGFVFYLLFFAIYIKKDRKTKAKVPLIVTNRVKRLISSFVIISFLTGFIGLTLLNFTEFIAGSDALLFMLRYGIICFTPMLLPFTVLAAYYVNEPFERYNNRRYVKKCAETLASRPDLIKIGITGSYGKTSVKEILATILSEKYSVLATPHSFNTPMGECKTVKKLKPSHEVFIAGMGARNVGDIKELAETVKPEYAIITGITGQHIETFGTLENVRKTKYELIESMGEKGFAVFSTDSENTLELMRKCPFSKIGAGILKENSPAVYAENVKVTASGTKFTLCFGSAKTECSTVLMGTHNVANICMAAAMAEKLGLDAAEIAAGINRIKPIKHRLELVENDKGYTIIDDSYNANVNGTIAAMEVLDCFEGRKIVVTPGLVELGNTEDLENYQFGRRLASHANVVILVGKRRIDKIKEGLVSVEFPGENIICVNDLDAAGEQLKKLAKRGDVIIFENDLPDKYN